MRHRYPALRTQLLPNSCRVPIDGGWQSFEDGDAFAGSGGQAPQVSQSLQISPRRPCRTQGRSSLVKVAPYHLAFASSMSMAHASIPDAIDAQMRSPKMDWLACSRASMASGICSTLMSVSRCGFVTSVSPARCSDTWPSRPGCTFLASCFEWNLPLVSPPRKSSPLWVGISVTTATHIRELGLKTAKKIGGVSP